MPSLVQLSALRSLVLQRANMESSPGSGIPDGLVSVTEVNGYINDSAAEFDDLLYMADQSSGRKSYSFSAPGGADMANFPVGDHFAMPSDFRSLLGVDYALTGTNPSMWLDVNRCPFEERNKYTLRPLVVVPGVVPCRYYMEQFGQGATSTWYMVLTPAPNASGFFRAWYRPIFAQMAVDTDSIDAVNWMQEYVVVDAAIKCLIKEEADVSTLMARKQELKNRVENMTKDRDAANPEKISDQGVVLGWDGGPGWY